MTDAEKSSDEHIIICNPWADRSPLIECVQRTCSKCGAVVALDAKNAPIVEHRKIAIVCIDCIIKENNVGEFGGAMVGGFTFKPKAEIPFEEVRSMMKEMREDAVKNKPSEEGLHE